MTMLDELKELHEGTTTNKAMDAMRFYNFLRSHGQALVDCVRDADRYRWLRNEANGGRASDPLVAMWPSHPQRTRFIVGLEVDEAIDAARAK